MSVAADSTSAQRRTNEEEPLMKTVYAAVLQPIEDSSGYVAHVPDVNGCVTTGTDLRDALENIRDALAGCICTLEDYRKPIPVPTPPENISHDDHSVVALVDVDTLKYREETDTRAVRKNVSMPAWLSQMAERAGINCSAVLQAALKRELHLAD